LPLDMSFRVRAHGTVDVDPDAFDRLVRRSMALGDTSLVVELALVCQFLNDVDHARQLYDRFSRVPAVFSHGGMLEMTIKGPIGLCLGDLALVLGETDRAARHFEEAHAHAERVGAHRFSQLARQGLERAGGAAPRAPAPAPAPDALPRAALPATFSLTREGDVWRITCGEETFRLKDSKGIQMLERLIAEPGREFHALDLVVPQAGAQDLGDSGEALDPRARADYQRRVVDLRAQLTEAVELGDPGRAEAARTELDFIGRELSRALGLGRRGRRTGSNAERARVNAQRRLRDAIRRIGEQHRELGKHLAWAVRTGTFCSYSPDE
jgi:hypothetical protein